MEIENSLELDQIHDVSTSIVDIDRFSLLQLETSESSLMLIILSQKMAHDCSIKSEDSESRSFRDEIRPLARARRRPPKSRCGFHSGSKSDLKPCLKQ